MGQDLHTTAKSYWNKAKANWNESEDKIVKMDVVKRLGFYGNKLNLWLKFTSVV